MFNQNNDNIESEIFKDIPGYEGMYQVSNFGRVKSFKRYSKGKILRPGINSHGYLQVGLWRDKKGKIIKVHKLVMQAFVGECPDELQVNHLDGIKTNNHLSNLEYCTHSQNLQHAHDMGLKVALTGEDNGLSKLTRKQVLEIRSRYSAGGISHRQLAREFGVGHATIGSIVNRERWTHIGIK